MENKKTAEWISARMLHNTVYAMMSICSFRMSGVQYLNHLAIFSIVDHYVKVWG